MWVNMGFDIFLLYYRSNLAMNVVAVIYNAIIYIVSFVLLTVILWMRIIWKRIQFGYIWFFNQNTGNTFVKFLQER